MTMKSCGCAWLTWLRNAPHLGRVHLRTQAPVQLPLQGTDAAIDVGEFPLIAVTHHRAQRSWCPTAANPGHAAKTRLVLKHQANGAFPYDIALQHGRQLFGERFFFHSSWTEGWALGCRVSGATLRQ